MRSYRASSAGGMACNTVLGSGAGAALGCDEQATSETLNSRTAAARMSRDVHITGPKLPHNRGIVGLRRPDQRDDPSNHAPSQKKVEQEDRQEVPLAPGQGNDRRQKIHHEPKAEEREEEC